MVDLIFPLVVGALTAGAVLVVPLLMRSKFRGVNRQADSSKSNTLRLRQYWTLFLAEGVILVLLGCVQLMGILVERKIPISNLGPLPFMIPLFLLYSLQGFLFLLLGIVKLKRTVAMWPARGSWCSMISAVLAILILPTFWAVTLYFPLMAVLSMYFFVFLFFIAFLLVEGMAMITYALDQRRERSQRWRWMLLGASGAGYLLVVIMFPLGPLLAFFLMPVALLFGGATMIAVALTARGGSEHVARA
jgi:uncharacterized membrane protein HdeD (DUF308 family)